MKNKTLKFITCALGIFFFILSCQQEELFLLRPQTDFNNPKAMPSVYRDAIKWYRENSWRVYENCTKSGERHPLFGEMEPNWEQALIGVDDQYITIEATLKTLESVLFILPQNTEMFEKSEDKRYRQTITRLVVRTNKITKETDAFFMSILPSPAYLEAVNFKPFYKNSYLQRDELFEGVVIFHDLNGTRANGYVYENGQLTRILPRSDNAIITKGTTTRTHCVDVYEEVCTTFEVVTEYDGQIVDSYITSNCITTLIGQDCWTEVIYTPDETVGGGGNGGSGGSVNWEYEPPVCKKCGNSPCTCIRLDTAYNRQATLDVKITFDKIVDHGVFEDFIDKYKDSIVEWSASYGERKGKITLDTICTKNSPVGVPVQIGDNTIASIHNHPSGNGPSITDAYVLATDALTHKLRTAYVCTAEDKIFALHITNPAAAESFVKNHCDSTGLKNMKNMCYEYMDIQKEYDREKFDEVQASLYSLSTVLTLTGSGIEVLEGRPAAGGMVFDIKKGRSTFVETDRIIRRSICPGKIK